MLKIAKSALGRRLWRLAKTLGIPLSEAAKCTPEELDFYDFSMLAENPKQLEKYENSFFDPEYEAFEKSFDEEMSATADERILMRKTAAEDLAQQGYDVPADVADDEEWERVE